MVVSLLYELIMEDINNDNEEYIRYSCTRKSIGIVNRATPPIPLLLTLLPLLLLVEGKSVARYWIRPIIYI